MKTITMNNRKSPIRKVEHDQEATMRLTWSSGNVYEYANVRMNDAVDLAWSEHPMQFFNAKFRANDCRQVEPKEQVSA